MPSRLLTAFVAVSLIAAAKPAGRPNTRPDPEQQPSLPFAFPGAPRPPGFAKPAAKPRPDPATLPELLAAYPADSLVAPLRRFEADHGRAREGAEAAFTLAQLHYARGEYQQAEEAFARAAARYSPDRKPEARFWQGLSALGAGDAVQARSALEEIAQGGSARRSEARYALAEGWVKAGRPERAMEELKTLLAESPGPLEPQALDRLAGLSERLGDAEEAKRATARLQKLRPDAPEVVRRPQPPAPAVPVAAVEPAVRGNYAIQIGAFADAERARALLASAKQAGFPRAQLVTQGAGGARLYLVRIGGYPNETGARNAGERASRELGVAYRLIRP